MDSEQIEVMIPIILFIVTGLVFISFFYFKHRTKAVFAEKGYSADEIVKIFNLKQNNEKAKNPNRYLFQGAVVLFTGIGFGLGEFAEDYFGKEYLFVPLLLIFIGIGLFVGKKLITEKN